jgi:hypothetical protein
MKLTAGELEYLAAWARAEWEPDCYQRPVHRLQLAQAVVGAHVIDLIKAWTTANGLKDQAILAVAGSPAPPWPWPSAEEFQNRLQEAFRQRAPGAAAVA